jgi:hypothetical protein
MNKTKGLTEKREEGRYVEKSNQEETEVCRSVVQKVYQYRGRLKHFA